MSSSCVRAPLRCDALCCVQVAIKISRLILPDDLSVNIQHKPWHGKQPTTLTAVTLYIATQLGNRVMRPGIPVRAVNEVRIPPPATSSAVGWMFRCARGCW